MSLSFALTEEQRAIRDLAARILGDRTSGERRAAFDGGFDRETWSALADAGLLGAGIPAADGGLGQGTLGMHLLLEQVGAAAAPLPAWEALVLGAMPLAAFGDAIQRAGWIPPVLSGQVLVTAALVEDGAAPADPRTEARRVDGGWELTGAKSLVPLAAEAACVLVPARTDDGRVGVWLVDPSTPGVELRAQEVLGGQPHAEMTLRAAGVTDGARLGGPEDDVLGWLLQRALAGIASVQAGACAAALRLTAEHAKRREQFDRPIATFQAVGQRLADAYIDVEAVQLTALQAAWRLDAGLPAADEVAIAKWWAAEAGHRVLHTAHHIHGGIGVDREYPLHRYFALTKRLELALGGPGHHLRGLGAALAAQPV
jgi:3-oxocholest-4-en-26-oyl-CoA dehydrogenase beta subunit